jgi:hypothetical protein
MGCRRAKTRDVNIRVRLQASEGENTVAEKQIVDQLKSKLMDLGYPLSSIKADVRTAYGRTADLVVFEDKNPWVVFELKASPQLELPLKPEEAGFHPTVRQAQSLAQEIGAPYFAVFDGHTISWFDVDKEDGRPRFLQTPIVRFVRQQEQEGAEDSKDAILHVLFSLADVGRQFFDLRESIIHIGMAVLARLMSEVGDRKLETFLLDFSPHAQLFDDALADLVTAQDERSIDFYSEAFSFPESVKTIFSTLWISFLSCWSVEELCCVSSCLVGFLN